MLASSMANHHDFQNTPRAEALPVNIRDAEMPIKMKFALLGWEATGLGN